MHFDYSYLFVLRQQVCRLSLIGMLIFCAPTTTKENDKMASLLALLLFHTNCFKLHAHDFDQKFRFKKTALNKRACK